jgi:hypothetical protein
MSTPCLLAASDMHCSGAGQMCSKGWRRTVLNRCWPGCRLDMSENALRQLPPGLCHCQHLIELNLAENMLTCEAFPKDFTSLTRLTCK